MPVVVIGIGVNNTPLYLHMFVPQRPMNVPALHVKTMQHVTMKSTGLHATVQLDSMGDYVT